MERRSIVIRGTVQGVGFRPFVFGLASNLNLGGTVRNFGGSVQIDVEGETAWLDRFMDRLVADAPTLARITDVSWQPEPTRGRRGFSIEPSDSSISGAVVIAPDAATCVDCLAELFDPRDRRFGYPFLNCTNCGPRLTIVTGAPYDRERTTMAAFPMCALCRAEYDDPQNRRFHAQPTACPVCGPKLTALDGEGRTIKDQAPLAAFVDALRAGKIGAMKGLGGFHLICDARNASAVAELRRRKHRHEKPFAVMVADLVSALQLCDIDLAEQSLLTSIRRPIVLLRKRARQNIAAEVAPGNPLLGVMLPYTPLHHLLARTMESATLVMTSGNRTDEPIAFENDEAVESLQGIADVFLVHDRPIHVRCDDSVIRIIGRASSPVRRSRGDAPQPIPLPTSARIPILAVGGQMKSTFGLAYALQAVLSHHLGDLDHFKASQAFERDITLYEKIFQFRPACIAHDLHPDYASTRYALARAKADDIPRIGVQHHHAHMASCMAENGLTERVIGVAFDGTGYGPDGAIWGGEFLIGDCRSFERAAHLRYVALPGGESAVRQPWRMAVAHAADANVSCNQLKKRLPASSIKLVRTMIDRRLNSPLTSSMGRLFDAVASLIGLRDVSSYEGQAAMEVEWLASSVQVEGSYPFDLIRPDDPGPLVIDTRPLIKALVEEAEMGTNPDFLSRRFHSTLVKLVCCVCIEVRRQSDVGVVVLSGGTFMNALLAVETVSKLESEGFRVYRHQVVPSNDGGLSLGQLAVAAAQPS